MNKLKCPLCGEELKQVVGAWCDPNTLDVQKAGIEYTCFNEACGLMYVGMTAAQWQLIDKRRPHSIFLEYALFTVFLAMFAHDLRTGEFLWALFWLGMTVWSAVDVARLTAKREAVKEAEDAAGTI